MLDMNFKFHYVENGKQIGFRAKKGSAKEGDLILADETIDYEDIIDTTTRDNRLVLVYASGESEILQVYKVKALELEKFIDKVASKKQAKAQEEKLIAEGKGELFRAEKCPHCESTVNLSELENTKYIYCRYCESVFEVGKLITCGDSYRICDECSMFDRTKGYTEFYFYFLVIIYGFTHNRRHICDNCVRPLFWKVFLINFIFILGIFPALWMKIKSMIGRDANLKKLARANALAKKGKMEKAQLLYEDLHVNYLEHPGLLMNEGLGYLKAGNTEKSIQLFTHSLNVCSNYYPTIDLIENLQK